MDDRIWQIGIAGTFDVENYGDLLFPLIAEYELTQRLGAVAVRPFSYHAKSPSDWPYQVTALSELPGLIERLDGMLIGGGHVIRFDKDIAPGYAPPTPDLHHPTGYWLTPALIAGQAGVPTVWNAPGVHGDFPAWARSLLVLAFRESAYIAVRDQPSRQALAEFAPEITVVPDTAFGVRRLLDARLNPGEVEPWRAALGDRYIVIQATTGLESFIRLVRRHPQILNNHKLVVVPIGPVLCDREEHVVNLLPHVIRLPAWPGPLALAALIGQAQAVVGSSLHLAITALANGVPVFRPAHCFDGKYEVLSGFDTVFRFEGAGEIDVAWFKARLGRRRLEPLARSAVDRLAQHWDRIAEVLAAGRLPAPTPAYLRFWQALPNLLEAWATRPAAVAGSQDGGASRAA